MSVLMAQYSTASLSAWPNWIILLIALPPPPPTPTTLITHGLTTALIATRDCVVWRADEPRRPECIVYACELHCSAASTAIVRTRTGSMCRGASIDVGGAREARAVANEGG